MKTECKFVISTQFCNLFHSIINLITYKFYKYLVFNFVLFHWKELKIISFITQLTETTPIISKEKMRKQYDETFEQSFTTLIIPFFENAFNKKFQNTKELVQDYCIKRSLKKYVNGLDWKKIDQKAKEQGLINQDKLKFSYKYFHDNVLIHNMEQWSDSVYEDIDVHVNTIVQQEISQLLEFMNNKKEYQILRHKIILQVVDQMKLNDNIHPYKRIEDRMRKLIDKTVKREFKFRNQRNNKYQNILNQQKGNKQQKAKGSDSKQQNKHEKHEKLDVNFIIFDNVKLENSNKVDKAQFSSKSIEKLKTVAPNIEQKDDMPNIYEYSIDKEESNEREI